MTVRQRHIAPEELYTNLLVKAVEQLGATREEKTTWAAFQARTVTKPPRLNVKTVPNTELRLGAIYALEKLAHDYEPLHWPIMEILCSYVRKNGGPRKPPSDKIRAFWECGAELKPYADVQAALTVIGRRSEKRRELEQKNQHNRSASFAFRLDLRECHLAGVNLSELHLERADFSGSCLEGAILANTHFEGAFFSDTHFEGTFFFDTYVDGAVFRDTYLQGARFIRTDFAHAICLGMHLEGADLFYAHDVTREMLENSYGDETTKLPEGLTRPENERWGSPTDKPKASGGEFHGA